MCGHSGAVRAGPAREKGRNDLACRAFRRRLLFRGARYSRPFPPVALGAALMMLAVIGVAPLGDTQFATSPVRPQPLQRQELRHYARQPTIRSEGG
jgi:hypothetical protein